MAAYAAVISLKHTINGIVNSSRISLVPSTRETLLLAYNEASSLQSVLERSNDVQKSRASVERLDALEGLMRDCVNKLEDVVDFHELAPQDEEVQKEVTSFTEAVKKFEIDYIEELSRDDDEDNDDTNGIAPSNTGGVCEEMVGHSQAFTQLRDNYLLCKMRPDDTYFLAFLGDVGSGRTAAANTVFEDLRQGGEAFFDCYAWVKVGKGRRPREILIDILSQVDSLAAWEHELLVARGGDEWLCTYLYRVVENRRYMIVLDDVHEPEVVELMKMSLPNESNGSMVLFTTGIEQVAELGDGAAINFRVPDARVFEDAAWIALYMIHGWAASPSPEVEENKRKIIENCRCLRIAFAKTLLYLFHYEIAPPPWSEVAADKENPIFMPADELQEISEIKRVMQYFDLDDQATKIIHETISEYINLPTGVVNVKTRMHPQRFFSKMQIIPVVGMAGIGKSFFVQKISKDELILSHFDHHVWLTLGPRYKSEEILIDILAQIYPDVHIKGDKKLANDLCVRVSHKRCLIVLDDLWSTEPLSHLKNLFPNIKGTTIVTTRLNNVAMFEEVHNCVVMDLLDEKESWHLLQQKVFVGASCPPELEESGHKIAAKCDGLPLLILKVAQQLLEMEISKEYWEMVASGKDKLVFMNAHREITEALLPSYQCLPQHLKPCFIYMGVFLERYEIRARELNDLWKVETFLETNSLHMEARCYIELAMRNLVLFKLGVSNRIKTTRLHSVFWHLSNSEAIKIEFFHAMNNYQDCLMENMKLSQRRICIRNSILLGMKDVRNSLALIKSVHSLLCLCPFNQYPVPLNFDWRLLRVMNAITIRLYEFPDEVVKLVHLRYLGLTCNGELPSSISNLLKLQYLIVKRYVNIISYVTLPVEIWEMKELEHLQVMGGHLPDRKCGDGLLKLSTLLDLSAQSCREGVLKWIPNLKSLGIRIELEPEDKFHSFLFLDNIHHLRGLESLKCVVVNPRIKSGVIPPMLKFPSSLQKLSLSGLGYQWEQMSIISQLENLETLKLKGYAFQGSNWVIEDFGLFPKLKYLLIEDTNLVHWNARLPAVINLERLRIKHCYKLKDLPFATHFYYVKNIEIVDCNSLCVSWAEETARINACELKVHLSWIAPPKET